MRVYLPPSYADATGTDDLAPRAPGDKLETLGVPHTYREYSGGHGWGYWRVHLRDALLAVTARMR